MAFRTLLAVTLFVARLLNLGSTIVELLQAPPAPPEAQVANEAD